MESPLHERIPRKYTLQRAIDLIIFFLLLCLLVYRLLSLNHHGVPWFLAFLCESWFTFSWILVMNGRWNPVDFISYPDRLLSRYELHELPAVDLFVTTADPVLEPPIITVNTVLSLLALDYPANKLACYVSDDGASPITYYALVEALEFAKHWVPFCRKHNILVRAPLQYFPDKENEACEVVEVLRAIADIEGSGEDLTKLMDCITPQDVKDVHFAIARIGKDALVTKFKYSLDEAAATVGQNTSEEDREVTTIQPPTTYVPRRSSRSKKTNPKFRYKSRHESDQKSDWYL